MDTDNGAPAAAAAADDVAASPGESPKKGGGLSGPCSTPKGHHRGHRRPSSEVGLRLITCTPQSTLGEVRGHGVAQDGDC